MGYCKTQGHVFTDPMYHSESARIEYQFGHYDLFVKCYILFDILNTLKKIII